jgi:hypothetical protein
VAFAWPSSCSAVERRVDQTLNTLQAVNMNHSSRYMRESPTLLAGCRVDPSLEDAVAPRHLEHLKGEVWPHPCKHTPHSTL